MEPQKIAYGILRECSIKVDVNDIFGTWATDFHLYEEIRKTDDGVQVHVWYIDNYDLQLRMLIMKLDKNHCTNIRISAKYIYLPDLQARLLNNSYNFKILECLVKTS